MRPLSEHETVLQVLREMVEQVILEASPVMATVTAASVTGEVYVRLDDAETAMAASVGRNPGLRLKVGDRVLVIRTLANRPVVVCPIAFSASGAEAARIGAEHLVEGAVTTAKIGPQAVTSATIATGAVATVHLAAGAVTKEKLDSTALTAGPTGPAGPQGPQGAAGGAGPQGQPGSDANLGEGSVKARHLSKVPNAAVESDAIGPQAVTSPKIYQGAVTTEKLADGAVTREKVKQEDGQPIFSPRGHGHDWRDVRDMKITTSKGELSLAAVLNRLWKGRYTDSDFIQY